MDETEKKKRWDPGEVKKKSALHYAMRLIRIEHTLFSLPFAYVGMMLSGYSFNLSQVVLAGLAVFGLRSAAMSFNNIADIEIDRKNPRTSKRPLVTGELPVSYAWIIIIFGSIMYYLSAYELNYYALLFSPILYLIAMSYPYSKRIHPFPHIHLGLSLGFVVFGGAIAASGSHLSSVGSVLSTVPWIYLLGVVFWVAGFDVIYSIMDEDFDRAYGLGSVAAYFGSKNAIKISAAFYAVSSASFFIGCYLYRLGLVSWISTIVSSMLMAYQVHLVNRDISKIPEAFNINLAIGIIISTGIILDKLL